LQLHSFPFPSRSPPNETLPERNQNQDTMNDAAITIISTTSLLNILKKMKRRLNIPDYNSQLAISFNNSVHRQQFLAIMTPISKSEEQNARHQKGQTKKFVQDQCWWG
jgi:hypothetical protein